MGMRYSNRTTLRGGRVGTEQEHFRLRKIEALRGAMPRFRLRPAKASFIRGEEPLPDRVNDIFGLQRLRKRIHIGIHILGKKMAGTVRKNELGSTRMIARKGPARQ